MESLSERVYGTIIVSFIVFVIGSVLAVMATLPKMFNLTSAQASNYNWMMWISESSISAVDWVDIALTILAVGLAITAYLHLNERSPNYSPDAV
jgi:hypothetical protein